MDAVGTLEVKTMFIMDESGDTRLQWRRGQQAEVTAAEARFNMLKGRGYLAYKVTAGGGQGDVLDAFDPNAERIIMVPPMVGG